MNTYWHRLSKCILIALVGISGCSYSEYQSLSQKDQKKLEIKLKKWGEAEKRIYEILNSSETKDFKSIEHDFDSSYRELVDLHGEFDEMIGKVKEQELKSGARKCSSQMSRIEEDIGLTYTYYEDYQESRELQDEQKVIVNEGRVLGEEQAKKQYLRQKQRYMEQRSETRRQILDSGILDSKQSEARLRATEFIPECPG